MSKVKLEMDLVELSGVKCLFQIGEDTELVEGTMEAFENGYVRLKDELNCKTRWVAEDLLTVVKVLFRS